MQQTTRKFLPADFTITGWAGLEPWYKELAERKPASPEALQQWLADWSELESVVAEDASWRQIRMTCDTTDPSLEQSFNEYCLEIEPHMKPWVNRLQQHLLESPFLDQLPDIPYFPFLRNVRTALGLFREANIPIQASLGVLAQQYGTIVGDMSVTLNGQEYTLQQALRFLEEPDAAIRKEAFEKIRDRRLQDREKLDRLMDELLEKRQQVALNAGFSNYRDYKFSELGRFDYSPEDCLSFHEAIKKHILPLQERILEYRRRKLGLDRLAPYDTAAAAPGEQPLKPFRNGEELIGKSIEVFGRLRPAYAGYLRTMKEMGRLDLDSRKGKAPGGYNCPLAETGVPFIFMNAAGTTDDVITMMHEGGHAIHAFLSHTLPLNAFRDVPMEIAELASMSMELFSMEHWSVFFPVEEALQRARREELERVIDVLPWIAIIDKFQHWLYTHAGHTPEERTRAWLAIHEEFSPANVDWSGQEAYRAAYWQKQLHLYEVPFYYIEYGIAQLGAVAMWRQYQADPEATLDRYERALSLGYTRTLPELYREAGIPFAFDEGYLRELGDFLQAELAKAGM